MVVTFWTPDLMASYWISGGHLATKTVLTGVFDKAHNEGYDPDRDP